MVLDASRILYVLVSFARQDIPTSKPNTTQQRLFVLEYFYYSQAQGISNVAKFRNNNDNEYVV